MFSHLSVYRQLKGVSEWHPLSFLGKLAVCICEISPDEHGYANCDCEKHSKLVIFSLLSLPHNVVVRIK